MDLELQAMSEIIRVLDGLEAPARSRVISWTLQRYEVTPAPRGSLTQPPNDSEPIAGSESLRFREFHELFDAANPDSGPDNALVAAFWFQIIQGQKDVDSFQLNKALKDLGHPSTNITRDLDRLMERTPRPVMQTHKAGISRQARKRYRLTREGVKAVERMLSRQLDEVMSSGVRRSPVEGT